MKIKSKNALADIKYRYYRTNTRAKNIYQQLKEKSMINKYTAPIFLMIISLLHSEAFAKVEFKKAKTASH